MDEEDPLVRRRAAVNPYLRAADLIAQRMLWDLSPQSWVSRRRLHELRDAHQGEKAVIICNGPSLLKSDLGLLKGTYTFGLNKINLLFDRREFRPSCIVAMQRFVLEQNAEFYNSTEIPLFVSSESHDIITPRKNVVFLYPSGVRAFAKDCSMAVDSGHTVTFVALQLAFHMGFQHVALIGADHDFATKGTANKTVVAGERDESHFDPRYFSGGVKWVLPDLFQSEISYEMARQMFQAHDRTVVNSTEGGKLEIFPRMALCDFLSASVS
jgi:hypothetical protein